MNHSSSKCPKYVRRTNIRPVKNGLTASVVLKQQWTTAGSFRAQELWESWGGRPGLPIPNSPYSICGRKTTLNLLNVRAQELWESWSGRPGLPVCNSPYSLCGRKATLNLLNLRAQELWEGRGGCPYGLCGREATLKSVCHNDIRTRPL